MVPIIGDGVDGNGYGGKLMVKVGGNTSNFGNGHFGNEPQLYDIENSGGAAEAGDAVVITVLVWCVVREL